MTITNVHAQTNHIKLGDAVPGIKIHLKTSKVNRDKDIFQIIDTTTNELVYCIEPGVMLYEGEFTEFKTLDDLDLDITEEQLDMIERIAYYGYQYNEERSTLTWYAITQFTIWDYILQDKGEVYFLNSQNKKDETLYQAEIAALYDDAKTGYTPVSFREEYDSRGIYVNYGDSLELTDTNNVLSKYTITTNNNPDMNYEINGNKITFNFAKPGSYYAYLARSANKNHEARIFYNGTSQTVIGRGSIYDLDCALYITVYDPSLKIKKVSSEDSNLALPGATISIYRENGDFMYDCTTDQNGEIFFEYFTQGRYYLVEKTAPYGYQLNPEKIYFTVDYDTEVIMEDEPILKRLDIEKYLENADSSLELEPNAKFQVYNALTNELVTTFITNKFGKYELKLPYGSYILKQVSGKEGYALISDIALKIDENTVDGTNLVLKNPQIVGTLKLYKKDSSTKELILPKAQFKIWNKDTHSYFKINDIDIFETKDGFLEIPNLPYGHYELVEVSSPLNYRLNNERLSFTISKPNEVIELDYFNELMKGSIIIKKVDSLTSVPLSNVVFGLYDANNNLLGEYTTNSEGLITINDLPIGTYYLKELLTNEEYLLNPDIISVLVKDNHDELITVSNRHLVEVPKTASHEFLITLLVSVGILLIGILICNYGKEN